MTDGRDLRGRWFCFWITGMRCVLVWNAIVLLLACSVFPLSTIQMLKGRDPLLEYVLGNAVFAIAICLFAVPIWFARYKWVIAVEHKSAQEYVFYTVLWRRVTTSRRALRVAMGKHIVRVDCKTDAGTIGLVLLFPKRWVDGYVHVFEKYYGTDMHREN